jgi:hypothetical protein
LGEVEDENGLDKSQLRGMQDPEAKEIAMLRPAVIGKRECRARLEEVLTKGLLIEPIFVPQCAILRVRRRNE